MTALRIVMRFAVMSERDLFLGFFFSSRRRHTRYWRDWSSDVCSSDLTVRLQDRSPIPRVSAVPRFVSVTLASVIAAPEGSVTDPVIEPYVDCPCRNEQVERTKATNRATVKDLRDIMQYPPRFYGRNLVHLGNRLHAWPTTRIWSAEGFFTERIDLSRKKRLAASGLTITLPFSWYLAAHARDHDGYRQRLECLCGDRIQGVAQSRQDQ